MDTRRRWDVIDDGRERRMGVAGGRRCVECGVLVHWRVEKFCLGQPKRFGGRIYCLGCQREYEARASAS